MDCKTTSTNRNRRGGFTLVEVLISSGLASMVLLLTTTLSFYSGRSFAAMANYVDLDSYSRKTLDRMTKEIRQANYLVSGSDHRLEFSDFDGTRLVYNYNPSTHTLTRVKNGVVELLLKECDQLRFSIFQRNPIGGTYDQYPTAAPVTCKLVQLHWTCSRALLGLRINTESVQSAKIVIRKQ